MAEVDERFKVRIGYLQPETLEIAKKELHETPQIREKAIIELRKLLHAAKDLHFRDDDEFLLIFLRACHFYPKSAIDKMRKAAQFKRDYAGILGGLMPIDEMSSIVDHNVVNILGNCDQKGRKVLIVNSGGIWDPKDVTPDSIFRIFYIIHLTGLLEPETQIRGVVVIMNFENLTLKQVAALKPAAAKRLLTFIQDAMPLRLKEVHIVNQPLIFKTIWSLFKPFIKEKISQRTHLHGKNMKSLHKFLDPAFLPEDYGGKLPRINYSGKDWYSAIAQHEDFIWEWNQFGFADSN